MHKCSILWLCSLIILSYLFSLPPNPSSQQVPVLLWCLSPCGPLCLIRVVCICVGGKVMWERVTYLTKPQRNITCFLLATIAAIPPPGGLGPYASLLSSTVECHWAQSCTHSCLLWIHGCRRPCQVQKMVSHRTPSHWLALPFFPPPVVFPEPWWW